MNDNPITKIPINNIKLSSIFSKRKIATNGYCEGPIYRAIYSDITNIITNRASNKMKKMHSEFNYISPIHYNNYNARSWSPKFQYNSVLSRRDYTEDPFLSNFRYNYGGTDHDRAIIEDVLDSGDRCYDKYITRYMESMFNK